MDIIQIPTHLIDEDKEQPRYQFDEEALQELMDSIGELGLLSPIKVRTTNDGRYKIIYGNRRYKACSALKLPTIPCIVSNVTDEMEIYLEQIAENLTRQGFSPIEEAEAFNKLLNDPKFSSSIKYLSSKLGKPENYIKNKLDLLKFSNAVRSLIVYGTEIKKGKLTEDQLMPLKDLSMEYRDSLALIMAEDEMSVPDVKRIARLFKDKEVSDSTKGKLLFKTGPQLLETWSSFEQTKKERAKNAELKEEASADNLTATISGSSSSVHAALTGQTSGEERTADSAGRERARAAHEEARSAAASAISEVFSDSSAEQDQAPDSYIESLLNLLLATLPAPSALSAKDLPMLEGVEREQFVQDVDTLIGDLEKHLTEWRSVKDMLTVRN